MNVTGILIFSAVLLLFSSVLYFAEKFPIKRPDLLFLISGGLALTLLSLTVSVRKIGGTVVYTSHGWPHFFMTYSVKDAIEGFLIQEWSFIPGSFFIYPLANLVFYLSAIVFLYLAIRLFYKSEKKMKFIMPAVIILISLPLLGSKKVMESYIKHEIDQAKYCQTDTDCTDAGSKCPFGCYAYVNKNEAGRISGLINSFDSKCVYSCVSCPAARCENHKCREVCPEMENRALE